ncbi:unnamed protein product [Fraxinus pennsylvanica]|uniref:Uncharacterized protein n=1 Tax=Fraxinus pennsylvanica TaxID=56036 RepID=A0AAD2A275_9LAMI|nr:unnamed protein product [Fraxinus pennsylvanica]
MWVTQKYLTDAWKLSFTHAAGILNICRGLTIILPVGSIFLVDAFLGNYKMLTVSSIIYSVPPGPQNSGLCVFRCEPVCLRVGSLRITLTSSALGSFISLGGSSTQIMGKPSRDKSLPEHPDELKLFFTEVTFAKPKSSRNSSIEAFAVCENYSPPEGFNEKDLHRLLEKIGSPSGADDLDCSSGWLEGPNNVHIPFLACGCLSWYDSDHSYPLPEVADASYQSLDPVQRPILPPYKRALEMKKASSHGVRGLEKLSLAP